MRFHSHFSRLKSAGLVVLLALGAFLLTCNREMPPEPVRDNPYDQNSSGTIGALHGRVSDMSGNSLGNVLLTAAPTGATRTTEAAGTFEFNDLDPGVYTVTAELDGYITQTQADTVVADQVADMNFVLVEEPSGSGAIHGTVADVAGNPLEGVVLTAAPTGGTRTTLANGAFEFNDLDPGVYTVTAELDGYITQTQADTVVADQVADMNFVLVEEPSGSGTITGIITDATDDTPISGATVSTIPATATATTNDNGVYTFTSIEAGTYRVTVAVANYDPRTSGEFSLSDGETEAVNLELYPSQQGTGTVSGYVGHAQNEDMLEGVTITAGDGTTTTTDASGEYSMTVDASYMEFTATMDGYYEASRWEYIPSNGAVTVNFALSPVLTGQDYRFVLSWGETPRDLDSHLMTPEIDGETYEIYFAARGDSAMAPYARLDHDVTSGYGPETVTIFETFPGTYTYYVYNFSGGDISGCGAQLQVYDADGLVNTVIVPQTGEGEYWVVFELDGTNNVLTLVNEVREEEPAGAIADPNTHVKNY